MTKPLVSLVVATHEKPDHLRACLATLHTQTFRDFEAWVIHEPGDTLEMGEAERITKSFDERFHWQPYPERMNDWGNTVKVWGTRELATADYAMHLNGDNLYAPIFLERMMQPLLEGIANLTYVNYVSHYREWLPFLGVKPHRGFIDSGGVLCSREIMNEVGLPCDPKLAWADSIMVEMWAKKARPFKVPGLTWMHC